MNISQKWEWTGNGPKWKKLIIVKCLFIIIIISTVDLRLRDTDYNMITSFINNIVINASLLMV